MSNYCGEIGPRGFRCILAAGHTGHHLSIDNREEWKGTPGKPVVWEQFTREQTDELSLMNNPLLTANEIKTADPVQARSSIFGSNPNPYTGEFCTECGSDKVRRAGTCAVCEECGTTTGCG